MPEWIPGMLFPQSSIYSKTEIAQISIITDWTIDGMQAISVKYSASLFYDESHICFSRYAGTFYDKFSAVLAVYKRCRQIAFESCNVIYLDGGLYTLLIAQAIIGFSGNKLI